MASVLASTSTAAVAVAAPQVSNAAVSRSSNSLAMAPFRASALSGQKLQVACSAARISMASAEKTEEASPAGFTPPELNPDTPSPIFGGSTGGLLRKAQVEEFYVITWEAPKEQIFELPTGGAAIMRSGPNLLKLSRKEQCLALGVQLRNKFKIKYQFYRVFPNGEVQYLHPKDGVYPEKVNAGRSGVGINARSIGKNVNPAQVKFTGKTAYDL
jgi:photosystem I subunit 2